MDLLRSMTADERAEYHTLMASACFEGTRALTGHERGDAILSALSAADAAGKRWASWVLTEATTSGLATRGGRWLKTRETIKVPDLDDVVTVTRAAIYSVRAVDAERRVRFQPTLLADLTRDELAALIQMDREQLKSAQLNLRTHVQLQALMDAHPTCATVGAACHASGTTLGAYLAS